MLAKHIFENDTKEGSFFKKTPGKYTSSVETRLRRSILSPLAALHILKSRSRLKKEYHDIVKELGSTGAGLAPEVVVEGSAIANHIGEFSHFSIILDDMFDTRSEGILKDWPWWKELHSFWQRTAKL